MPQEMSMELLRRSLVTARARYLSCQKLSGCSCSGPVELMIMECSFPFPGLIFQVRPRCFSLASSPVSEQKIFRLRLSRSPRPAFCLLDIYTYGCVRMNGCQYMH
ncbi:hypothetical protein EUGRSUZ_E01139 [Eucalyptus grandis]|uniref:Uncharacterized protein n=2 Tax=Eucalyptus grandis TaxID=71139 RepID=A0ACC3KVQ8_EUCGR|nr:hypothetical protein EUGRSUZ_E01139 [Eucalyptus grandis]